MSDSLLMGNKRIYTRSKSAESRDQIILDSAIKLVASLGWDNFNFKVLAESCNISRSPLISRYGDTQGLALEIWKITSPAFMNLLTEFSESLLSGDAKQAQAIGMKFIKPNETFVTIAELMMASLYDSKLQLIIQASFSSLESKCPTANQVKQAQNSYANLVAIGFLLAHKRGRISSMSFETVFGELTNAYAHPGKIIVRPKITDGISSINFRNELEDQRLADLLQAMLDEVANRGYHQADVRTIARKVGVTEGTIYSRYASKLEMFLAATRLRLKRAFDQNVVLAQNLAGKHTFGVAQALIIFDAMKPIHQPLRRIRIEQLRLGWHSLEMKAVADVTEAAVVAGNKNYVPADTSPISLGEVHWAFSMGLAVSLLPEIQPSVANAHFEVVTVPIYDGR